MGYKKTREWQQKPKKNTEDTLFKKEKPVSTEDPYAMYRQIQQKPEENVFNPLGNRWVRNLNGNSFVKSPTKNSFVEYPFKMKANVSQPGDKAEIEADSAAKEAVNAHKQNSGSKLDQLSSLERYKLFYGIEDEVKIHNDSESHIMADELNAKAFTHGNDIYFGKGQYQPGTEEGQELLAHELFHTMQQDGGVQRKEKSDNHIKNIESQLASLTPEQKNNLKNIVGDFIVGSLTAFNNALQQVIRSYKAEIRANAAFAELFIEVAMGFLIPGLGRAIHNIVDKIPVNASNLTYRVALKALESDFKPTFNLITKSLRGAVKINAQALFGETDVEVFLNSIYNDLYKNLMSLIPDLPNKSNKELGVLFVSLHPSIVNPESYKIKIIEMVQNYKKYIKPIGKDNQNYTTSQGIAQIDNETKAYWVTGVPNKKNGEALALLRHSSSTASSYAGHYNFSNLTFLGWIPEYLIDIAIEKTKRTSKKDIETIPYSKDFR